MNIVKLKEKAKFLRRETFKKIYNAKQGHIGGGLSCLDVLTILYYKFLKYNPKNPNLEDRDRFILSKGHNCVPLYLILYDLGFFDEIEKFHSEGNTVGYPNPNVPGIELLTGALGHGIGVGAGIAFTAKKANDLYKTVVLTGDAECYEGSTWESAQFAAHHNLSNLIVIVDRNMQSVMGFTEEYNAFEPLHDKWKSFNWNVHRIDGHDYDKIIETLDKSWAAGDLDDKKPTVIIADTIKGKGVSYMERVLKWHHGIPNKEEYERGAYELE